MQQRIEPADGLDDFPTPPWATRALCEYLENKLGYVLKIHACREPAANRGHMVRPLSEYFDYVFASDIHDYGVGFNITDYLYYACQKVDWTITNPPFRLAERFIEKALTESKVGVAMIVRSAFLEGQGRYDRLFSKIPPSHVLQFSERVVMHKGKLSEKGSTATAYCWLVWLNGSYDTKLDWISPCRKKLERVGDYPPEPT